MANIYLLEISTDGSERVVSYTLEEMDEVFSPAARATIARGEILVIPQLPGSICYIDMVAAARDVFHNA